MVGLRPQLPPHRRTPARTLPPIPPPPPPTRPPPAQAYTWAALQRDYRLAVCDFVRFLAGWGWWGNSGAAAAKARAYLGELRL